MHFQSSMFPSLSSPRHSSFYRILLSCTSFNLNHFIPQPVSVLSPPPFPQQRVFETNSSIDRPTTDLEIIRLASPASTSCSKATAVVSTIPPIPHPVSSIDGKMTSPQPIVTNEQTSAIANRHMVLSSPSILSQQSGERCPQRAGIRSPYPCRSRLSSKITALLRLSFTTVPFPLPLPTPPTSMPLIPAVMHAPPVQPL